jgi:hypothetical protein
MPSVDDLIDLVYETVDHLLLLLARGWSRATIIRGPYQGGLSISKIGVQGSRMTKLPTVLGIDPKFRTALVSEILDDIQEELRKRGVVWDGLTVHVERSGDRGDDPIRVDFVTVGGGSIVTVEVENPDDDLITTPRLVEVIEREVAQWKRREATFMEHLGEVAEEYFNADNSALEFHLVDGTTVNFPVEVIGSWAEHDSVFTWAWADGRFEPEHHEGLRQLRSSPQDDVAPDSQFNIFRFPMFPAEPDFARVIAQLANSRLRGRMMYQIEEDGDRTFFCLSDNA